MKLDLETRINPTSLDEARKVIKELYDFNDRLQKNHAAQLSYFKEQIRMLAARIFSPSTEHLVTLLFNEAELIDEVAAITGEKDEAESPDKTSKKGVKKKRNIIPEGLPVEQRIHDLPDEEKFCPKDGTPLHVIGQEVTKQLGYIPARFKVIENVTLKYGCETCEETIKQSKQPPQLLPKSVATPELLAQIIISKYENHLPLYRQEQMYAQHGVSLSRTVMADWVIKAALAFRPLYNIMLDDAKSGDVIQCDETPYRVLTVDGIKVKKKNYLWVLARWGPDFKVVYYHHATSRSANVAKELLSEFRGYLQVDGYSGYDWTSLSPDIIRVGCLAHIRRKFADFLKTLPKKSRSDHAAARVVKLIKKLYDVEENMRVQHITNRKDTRQQDSLPVFEELAAFIDKESAEVLPSGLYGSALQYAKDELPLLKRYLDHDGVEIDNNLVENAIRPFCLGKKNWLFADTEKGAEASAILYSLIMTARNNGLNPRDYLAKIIDGLPRCETLAHYQELLPYKVS